MKTPDPSRTILETIGRFSGREIRIGRQPVVEKDKGARDNLSSGDAMFMKSITERVGRFSAGRHDWLIRRVQIGWNGAQRGGTGCETNGDAIDEMPTRAARERHSPSARKARPAAGLALVSHSISEQSSSTGSLFITWMLSFCSQKFMIATHSHRRFLKKPVGRYENLGNSVNQFKTMPLFACSFSQGSGMIATHTHTQIYTKAS